MFSIRTCRNCLSDVPADTVSRMLKCCATRPCDALQLRWINLFLHSFIYPPPSSILKSIHPHLLHPSLFIHRGATHAAVILIIHPSIVSPPPQNKNPVLTRFSTADCVFQPGATRHDSILFAPSALSHSLCVSVSECVCLCECLHARGYHRHSNTSSLQQHQTQEGGGGGKAPSRIHQ